MANTRIHKYLAKGGKQIPWADMPPFVLNYCDRINFKWGRRRALRKKITENIVTREFKRELYENTGRS